MKPHTARGFSTSSVAVALVAAATLLSTATACSGVAQQPAATPQIPSVSGQSLEAKTKKPASLIFAADEGSRSGGAAVYAYLNSGHDQSPLWSIGSPLKYPTGLWVDGSLNLYVADSAGYVYEYDAPTAAGPPSAPSLVYADAGEEPNAVATCGKYVYASNSTGENSAESFTVWTNGVAKPLRTVIYKNGLGAGQGITCDTAGNVYFAYQLDDNGGDEVDVWPPGGTGSPTKLPMTPEVIEGFALSISGLLVLGNQYDAKGPAVEFYKQTKNAPVREIIAPWLGLADAVAYEKSDKALWIADLVNKALDRVNPGKGTLLNAITKPGFSTLTGVALSPPDHP